MNKILHSSTLFCVPVFVLLLLLCSGSKTYAQIISTFAGNGTTTYSGDGGPATAAGIKKAWGVASDGAGNIYIADGGAYTIRKVNSAGIITSIGGNGTAGYTGDGGAATAAQLRADFGLAADATGNIYIADYGNDVIRKINAAGIISTYAGGGPSTADGIPAVTAKLGGIHKVSVDGAGNIYFCDETRARVRKVNSAGIITTIAGMGVLGFSGDGGPATAAQMQPGLGIALDNAGNVYVAEASNYRIRKISAAGIISTVAGNGTNGYTGDGGPATAAQIRANGLEIDAAGNIYFTDITSNIIRKVDASGIISTFAGNGTLGMGGDGGPATAAQLNFPTDMTIDGAGNLYVANWFGYKVRKITGIPLPTSPCSGGVMTTIAGTGTAGYTGDGGPATAAKMGFSWGVTMDGAGNTYMADETNKVIRKVNAAGVISTIAGKPGVPGSTGDGGPATAALITKPYGMSTDASGNIYIADLGLNTVRKINASGIITKIAGGGASLAEGVPATNAQLLGLYNVVADNAGNVYMTDASHGKVRKVNSAGIITTVAGNGTPGYSGDGGAATAAMIAGSGGITLDPAGNLYITDNSGGRVRKVTPAGIISTIAGNGTLGYSGDGGPATAAQIRCVAVAVDAAGNMYISDQIKMVVRKIDPAGIITTLAGTGTTGYSGDGGPAAAVQMNYPTTMCSDATGNVYISDWMNFAVRKVSQGTNSAPYFAGGHSQSITVAQNTVSNPINTQLRAIDADVSQNETWSLAAPAVHGSVVVTYSSTSTGGMMIPTGLTYTPTTGYSGNDSFRVVVTDCGGGSDYTVIHVTVTGVVLPCPPNIKTIAGTGTPAYSGDGGPATAAEIKYPWAIAMDAAKNIYFTDAGNNRLRKINTAGDISTVAGNGVSGYGGDGGPATAAQMNGIAGVSLDVAGNIYISENVGARIRKINTLGIISTVAGTGALGYSGDGGAATLAQIALPNGVFADNAGNIYIPDQNSKRIRKVTTAGIISTIGGTGVSGYSGDGGAATLAKIGAPNSVFVDGAGNVYFADVINNNVRKINAAGIISTVAGNGVTGYSGDGGPATAARLNTPGGVDVYGGEIFITDAGNNRVRKVDAAGIISTVAGTGVAAYNGDNIPATAAQLNAPNALMHDAAGRLYVTDLSNHRIRKISTDNDAPIFASGHNQSMTVCQNAVATPINTLLAITDIETGQSETWSVLSGPAHGTASASFGATSTGGSIIPTGLSYTPATGYSGIDIFTVVINDCSKADTTTITVTINAAPFAGTILGASVVCNGSATTLSNTVAGGVWSTASTAISMAGPTVTGMAIGTGTVTYSVASLCGTGRALSVISILPVPAPITGGTTLCEGVTIALTDAVAGGVWSSGSTGTAVAGASTGTVTGITAGTAAISYTIGGICATGTVVTVTPGLPAIKGGPQVCAGEIITLSDSVTGGMWSTLSGDATVNAGTGDVQGVSAGLAVITYYIPATGCTISKTIIVNAAVPPITNVADMCDGGETRYVYDAATGGIWTSAQVVLDTTGQATAYKAGPAVITYTLPTGCLTTASLTVNPLPGRIKGPGTICTGTLVALSDSTTGGAWSSFDATVIMDMTTGILYGVSPGSAVITYTMPTGCEVKDTMMVYATPGPITGVASVCPGSMTMLSNTTTGGSWSAGSGGEAAIGKISGVVTGISAGTTAVTYTTGAGCSAHVTATVLPLPALHGVTGGGNYCAGGAGLHILLSGSAGGTRYYLYTGGVLTDSLNGTGAALDYGLRTAGGNYTIRAKDMTTTCNTAMSGAADINIDAIRVPTVSINAIANDTVCTGTAVTFVASPTDGGTAPAYQWKVNGKDVGISTGSYSYTPADRDVIGLELTSNATCAAPLLAYGFIIITVVTPVVPIVEIATDKGLSITEGTFVRFTAKVTNSVPFASYQWQKNGVNITGEVNITYLTNDLKNGDRIGCQVGSGGECPASAMADVQMNVRMMDVNKAGDLNAIADQLNVLPNPTTGSFSVMGVLHIANEAGVTLQVTNMLGQEIYSGTANVSSGKLNARIELTDNIANGMYLLNVRSANGNKVFHIVVSR